MDYGGGFERRTQPVQLHEIPFDEGGIEAWHALGTPRTHVGAPAVEAEHLHRMVEAILDRLLDGAVHILSEHVVVDVETTDETGNLAKAFRHMVESLEEAQQKLVKAEKLSVLGKVAAGVAHEIKNPLAAIKMTIQVLQNRASKKEEDTHPYETISQEIDRLSIYISDLLDFANPSEMEVSEVNLNETIESILHIMERQFQHSNIEVQKNLPANLPVIRGDKNRIRQIIMNLVINAQQAMAPAGTLKIKAEAVEGFIKLSVSDSANKLPKESTEKIFEAFYSSKEGGTGLGLALVKKFTEQHGGSIEAKSENGETVFLVSFPLNFEKKNGV